MRSSRANQRSGGLTARTTAALLPASGAARARSSNWSGCPSKPAQVAIPANPPAAWRRRALPKASPRSAAAMRQPSRSGKRTTRPAQAARVSRSAKASIAQTAWPAAAAAWARGRTESPTSSQGRPLTAASFPADRLGHLEGVAEIERHRLARQHPLEEAALRLVLDLADGQSADANGPARCRGEGLAVAEEIEAFDARRRHGVEVGRGEQLAGAAELGLGQHLHAGLGRGKDDVGIGEQGGLARGVGADRFDRRLVTPRDHVGDMAGAVDGSVAGELDAGAQARPQLRCGGAHRAGTAED